MTEMPGIDEPTYLDRRSKRPRKAINRLPRARLEELAAHLQDCGKKVYSCDLCYELYQNVGGQGCIDLITSACQPGEPAP